MRLFGIALFLTLLAGASAQTISASRTTPNLVDNIERPLRYRPEGEDFVIENGQEFFNRPLYGGNTAFRVDGGDKPEFVLYLPGRGGNLRLGVRSAAGTKWLHEAARVITRYRPGELLYEVRDPVLGERGVLRIEALVYHETEGLVVRAEAEGIGAGVELFWAYGGASGERGKRDGDIGTENVPISQWFQLKPEFCADNVFEVAAGGFTLRAKPATIVGVMPAGATLALADAEKWSDAGALLAVASAPVAVNSSTPATVASGSSVPKLPVVVGRMALAAGEPRIISLQRLASGAAAAELDTYREVTADGTNVDRKPGELKLPPAYTAAELPQKLDEARQAYATIRNRVSVRTPDAFLNAAVGALNIAADAVWDDPQKAIMHGAIAWRTRLLGWRGPYSLDALGWHDRAREHFLYWAGRQNTKDIPEKLPPADENANLARNETGLHTNGDLSNSHYDMNLVYIDALFRHLQWTGDLELAKKLWPTIERHLAWERRLFRREFGAEKLPLYEAYAAIWASDDLQYHGGGAMHASAYNYYHNREAARLARLIGADPAIYQREAQLLERGMRAHLWLPERGWFGEYKDLLGLQRVHPSAALWTFYHTMDSEVPTPQEAWQMTRQVDTQLPHLPVAGPGVPAGLYTLGTTDWMPYHWSINNVVMAEVIHGALGFWQAGRPDEAWAMTKGSLTAAMFMGISPGNVGSMSYLDVYRRESQRDFADGSGVLSRALVEGLFGVKPDALGGELKVTPGWPADWPEAELKHPDVRLSFKRDGDNEVFTVTQTRSQPFALRLRLRARRDQVASVMVNGVSTRWHVIENAVGTPRIEILGTANARHEIVVRWAGAPIARSAAPAASTPVRREQGGMRWIEQPDSEWLRRVAAPASVGARSSRSAQEVAGLKFEPIDLTAAFNDKVTQIYKNEYRAPRSPYVSLALPKQGLGGWAGGMTMTAEIDDSGLRTAAARENGRLVLPNGVPLATPGEPAAKNILFTSLWDNYPAEASVPLAGRGQRLFLLMAGSTNHMQSRIENGEVVVTYADGSTARLALENPTTWWPIQEDYFLDDYQFRYGAADLPTRVDLKTGRARVLELTTFKGRGGKISGGAATVLELPLDSAKELKSLTVRTLSNEVVIGLMAATVGR